MKFWRIFEIKKMPVNQFTGKYLNFCSDGYGVYPLSLKLVSRIRVDRMVVVCAPAQKNFECRDIFINSIVQQSPSCVEWILLAAPDLSAHFIIKNITSDNQLFMEIFA